MKIEELAERLRHISMDVGTLTCLGCGHEHNCGTSGCAVLQEAADALEDKLKRTPLTADELFQSTPPVEGGDLDEVINKL